MKKLALVMVFVLLAALFIALNYLLWDRDSKQKVLMNLEYVNASNNARLDSQSREISGLEKDNASLGDQVAQLQKEKTGLSDANEALVEQMNDAEASMKEKIELLNVMKQNMDLKVLSEPVAKWADAISQGNYEDAYGLEFAAVPANDRAVTLEEYSLQMENSIRKIGIGNVELDKLRGAGTGEIYLEIKLTVKLAQGADTARFKEGINDVLVKIEYDFAEKTFFISSISSF